MHRSSKPWWRIIVFPPQDSCHVPSAVFIAFVFVIAIVATVVVIFRATLSANLIFPKIIIINASLVRAPAEPRTVWPTGSRSWIRPSCLACVFVTILL